MRQRASPGKRSASHLSYMPTQTATAGAPSTVATASNYQEYVNPQWVTLLNLLGMNVEYERCFGCELFTKDGRCIPCALGLRPWMSWRTKISAHALCISAKLFAPGCAHRWQALKWSRKSAAWAC